MATILIVAIAIIVWPKPKVVNIMNYYNDSEITNSNFNEFVKNNPGKKLYFFCTPDNNDCNYVNNTMLKEYSETLQMTKLDFIHFVDISNTQETSFLTFEKLWGFKNYPAFVVVDETAQPFMVYDSLGWDATKPFNTQELKEFMINNGVWPIQATKQQ